MSGKTSRNLWIALIVVVVDLYIIWFWRSPGSSKETETQGIKIRDIVGTIPARLPICRAVP